MRRLQLALVVTVAVLPLLAAGCGKPVDLKQVLQVTDLSGGYHDAGVVEGRNKIVPSVSFRLKKSTDDSLRPLSVNVVFKQLPKAAPWSRRGSRRKTTGTRCSSRAFRSTATRPIC